MSKVYIKRGDKGLPYAQIAIVRNGKRYETEALVKTGSNCTIVSNELLGVEIDKSIEPKTAEVGWEEIPVYEVDIDSFEIEGHEIEYVKKIYVSDLRGFKGHSIIGCDVMQKLEWGSEIGTKFYFVFPD